ncbi:hypothetical protein BTH78_09185, partial [Lactobacillus delbrueckii subsp. bulgaricus]|nr:hypothetical protein [Lactobacillus delbrueckii subsp. bulgaricus]
MQGEQVPILWPKLLTKTKISYAYKPFMWSNNAKNNAAVTVIILGLKSNSLSDTDLTTCSLFNDSFVEYGENISPYLTLGHTFIVEKRSTNLSDLPEVNFGSMANDGGNLILSNEEYNQLITDYPNAERYVKRF